ncbi:flagellar biosynthesis repressor FlbT [Methylocystis sp. IM3]|uniref:flagellar biosynthesis repressor FlbT n=1 Tax=unclassified Methylocystis TaxID=2625913 RepID=UPI000FBEB85D|nr:MAG: flagellar biosynthesis repressor FlbT [Hyphomicrobiales bacterium]
MNISLRRGERIFINGAVLKVDRKVCLELLNDVTFLLENHVMQADSANTPLKRLYFIIQAMLMSPNDCEAPLQLCREMFVSLSSEPLDPRIMEGLRAAVRNIEDKRMFDALKVVRSLFPLEAELLALVETDAAREVA